jgi:hypothetical protein
MSITALTNSSALLKVTESLDSNRFRLLSRVVSCAKAIEV